MGLVDEPVHVLEARERFRTAEEWYKIYHEDIVRRATEFRYAYAEIVKKYDMDLMCDCGHSLGLFDTKNQKDTGLGLY